MLSTPRHKLGSNSQLQWWKSASFVNISVKKACVKARILTGTYALQKDRAKFYKLKENSYCQLCSDGEENKRHFHLKCNSLETVRKPFLNALSKFSSFLLNFDISVRSSLSSDVQLLQLITDVTCFYSTDTAGQCQSAEIGIHRPRFMLQPAQRERNVEFWRLRQGEISFIVGEWDINLLVPSQC